MGVAFHSQPLWSWCSLLGCAWFKCSSRAVLLIKPQWLFFPSPPLLYLLFFPVILQFHFLPFYTASRFIFHVSHGSQCFPGVCSSGMHSEVCRSVWRQGLVYWTHSHSVNNPSLSVFSAFLLCLPSKLYAYYIRCTDRIVAKSKLPLLLFLKSTSVIIFDLIILTKTLCYNDTGEKD